MPQKPKKSVSVIKLLEINSKNFANPLNGAPKNILPYAPIKREGDRQMLITIDKERALNKKKLDKQISDLEFEIGGNILGQARQEGISKSEMDRLNALADKKTKELDLLKKKRKSLGE